MVRGLKAVGSAGTGKKWRSLEAITPGPRRRVPPHFLAEAVSGAILVHRESVEPQKGRVVQGPLDGAANCLGEACAGSPPFHL